jgi:hypothetical protein
MRQLPRRIGEEVLQSLVMFEPLESRRLLALSAADEQVLRGQMLDYINAARRDPETVAFSYGVTDLNDGLPAGSIAPGPKPELIESTVLDAVADTYADMLVETQEVGHEVGGTLPIDRERAGGFPAVIGTENAGAILSYSVYLNPSNGITQFAGAYMQHPGHRYQELDGRVSFVGIAVKLIESWPFGGAYFHGLLTVIDFAKPAIPGDVNLDGIVNTADFTVMAQHFGQAAGWTQGDVTGDGLVNAMDFNALASDFGS